MKNLFAGKRRGCLVVALIGLLLLCVFIGVTGQKDQVEKVPTKTAVIVTATETPTEIVLINELKNKVASALGTSNRNVDRLSDIILTDDKYIVVRWSINDNLSEELIIGSAKRDVLKILKTIHDSNFDYMGVRTIGTFPMTDVYGNSTEKNVVNVEYTKNTIDKINWDGFLPDNVFTIADINVNNTIFNK